MVKDKIPECCSEPMTPFLRYKEDGWFHIEFVCENCCRHQIEEWSPENHKECVR